MNKDEQIMALKKIEGLIYMVRGQKVMLSPHLAELYGVETRVLVQAVKRNIDRFPDDFMFPLSEEEFVNLKSQIVTSSWGGSRRAKPYAFTEQGVAMLSSVLEVNELLKSILKLCAHLSGCDRCWLRIQTLKEGLMHWNRGTMSNSKSFSMRSGR